MPTASAPLTLSTVSGDAIEPYLDDLARLRISVFREWPTLYDGDFGYEFEYLQTYLRSPVSIVVLARSGDQVVGAATGLPLVHGVPSFVRPFGATSVNPEEVFHFGESVLLPAYRGRGIGHRFFDLREAHARALGGYAWTAFCVVERPQDDPRRPPFQRSNEAFWNKRGYRPRPGLRTSLRWRESGGEEVPHDLGFWMRPLERL